MEDTKRALENNRVVLALTKSTLQYLTGYPKHKREKRFLIYMNATIGGSRCIKKKK